METIFATPKFFAVALPLTSHAVKKPTICFGGTNRSLASSRNQPNFFRASGLQMKRSNVSHLKNSGIHAAEISFPTEFQEDGLVFQQNFTIRSFEIGTDFKISMEALMNYLMETKLNHLDGVRIVAGGFGLTPQMIVRDLIWVICRYHIEVDFYPSWRDVIQVDTWMNTSGKTAIRRDWRIRDLKTGRTLIRATSLYVMMNKKTRKFARLSEEVIGDLKPFLMHCHPIIHKDSRKLLHLEADKADYVHKSLTPGWTDMDANQHVSHRRLANYALESVPRSVVESHELSAMTLEYRNECNGDSVLQSLSKVISNTSIDRLADNEEIEFDHSLDLECGQEIVRARTTWRPKYTNQA